MALVAVTRQRGVCCEIDVKLEPASAVETAGLLKALADPTRLSILAALRAASDPVCICDLTAAYDLSQPTISHHMAKLRSAGLVEAEKGGIWTYYRLADPLPSRASALLEPLLGR
ncbi:MAG: winged helix-turn-helix transcriptional regulator [Chloroflexi bacterium]|nr:MAG: winged helix-turn-helix transcriptional regulator [Chloroflexota bacterium]TMD53817.1 MAG: winged helix-turn-helix transcriptional regulator [Chloroflexota bacterium]